MNETPRVRRSPRRRIVEAAATLVEEGGYEALQVRALSERAEVSSRTIYANFPSLDSVLIVAAAGRAQELYRLHVGSPPRGRTAAARVQRLIAALTDVMTANRNLTVGMLRALLCGKPDVAQYVDGFGQALRMMLATAIAPDGASAKDHELAEILQAVWFTALIGWATGVDDDSHIGELMKAAANMLLKDR